MNNEMNNEIKEAIEAAKFWVRLYQGMGSRDTPEIKEAIERAKRRLEKLEEREQSILASQANSE